MRVLGIDCGTERTGFGVIETDGVVHHIVTAGVIRTVPRDRLARRLFEIWTGLRQVIADNRPQSAAIEEVFHAANVKTALKLAQVRGVALLAVEEAGLSLGEYSPLEVKTSVVGYGRAEKQQVQLMVQSLLRLNEPLSSEDASDAIAVAICHSTRASYSLGIGAGV